MSRVGVMIPTYNRPDFLRASVAQWCMQTVRPDVICVHQNGNPESYEWCVEDMKDLCEIKWLHTPVQIPQHLWYLVPLEYLLADGCDYFFWGDHDDMYMRRHVEECLSELRGTDFTIANSCGVLFTKKDAYKYNKPARFTAHAPGGMSSSMAFNRQFATMLSADIKQDLLINKKYYYTDNVVAFETMPKFRLCSSPRLTTVYMSHEGSTSSFHWAESELADKQQ